MPSSKLIRSCLLCMIFISSFIFPGLLQSQDAASPRDARRTDDASETYVPPQLAPWVSWVRESNPDNLCTLRNKERVCSWPGLLKLSVTDTGGKFEYSLFQDKKGEVIIPGGDGIWPFLVRDSFQFSLSSDNRKLQLSDVLVVTSPNGMYPSVLLPAGEHRIEGIFSWQTLPKVIQIPVHSGLVELEVNGHTVRDLRITDKGGLWLHEDSTITEDQKSGGEEQTKKHEETKPVSISVARLLQDGHPFQVITELSLSISGKLNAVMLGPIIPKGTTLIKVDSPLSYKIDQNKNFILETRPGSFTLRVHAAYDRPPQVLKAELSNAGGEWDTVEAWAWASDESLRSVEIIGGTLVDPSRARIPADWSTYPVYLLNSGEELQLVEKKRGEGEPRPNDLQLTRLLVLDQSGAGFSVRDSFSGTMNQGWRLNASPHLLLGRVSLPQGDVLITDTPPDEKGQLPIGGAKLRGVELRQTALSLTAESRIEGANQTFPAVGWLTDVSSLSYELQLGTGWRLFAATGADLVYQSWVGNWNLLNLFLILLCSAAVLKLFDWKYGLVAGLALTLFHGEWQAPYLCWFNLLAITALLRIVPESRVKKFLNWYFYASIGFVLMVLVPFILSQLLDAFYPQLATALYDLVPTLEDSLYTLFAIGISCLGTYLAWVVISWVVREFIARNFLKAIGKLCIGGIAIMVLLSIIGGLFSAGERMLGGASMTMKRHELARPAQNFADGIVDSKQDQMRGQSAELAAPSIRPQPYSPAQKGLLTSESLGYRSYQSLSESDKIDPNAKIQTGPGIPTNNTKVAQLSWSGLVKSNQEVRLYLIGPWGNTLLSLLRVVLAVCLFSLFWKTRPCRLIPSSIPAPTSTLLAFLAYIVVCGSANADDFPQPALLKELETRLMRNRCIENCTVASKVDISIADTNVQIRATVQSRENGSWALPGPYQEFFPSLVTIDEKPTMALWKDEGGYIWVRVPSGTHSIKSEGTIASRHATSLRFVAPTWHVTCSGVSWVCDGIDERGVVTSTLTISKAEIRDISALETLSTNQNSQTDLPLNLADQSEPWYRVTRTVVLGVKNRVNVAIERIGDTTQSTSVRLPLLQGESVVTPTVKVQDNTVEISFLRGQTTAAWDGRLPELDDLVLSAPNTPQVSESWVLHCSELYRCKWSGLNPTQTTLSGEHIVYWHPRPSEKVNLSVLKLAGSTGDTRTINSATISLAVGQRLLETSLELKLRASESGWYKLSLPPGVEIVSAQVNGKEQRAAEHKGLTALLVGQGQNDIELKYRSTNAGSLYQRMSSIDLGTRAVDVTTSIALAPDQWILYTSGPVQGPAVLFWPKLLLVLLAAFVLARFITSPLSVISWALLGFGLLDLGVIVMSIPVLWFGLVHWKRSRPEISISSYNLRQVLIALFGIATLICVYQAVFHGLIMSPDSQIVGYGSSPTHLNWYSDIVDGSTPPVGYLALPLWTWRAVMLSWSCWLVLSMLGWLRSSWEAFASSGYWKTTS